MRVYISGPITGVEDYKERFAKAEQELKEQGHIVINPAKVDETYPEFDYEDYMEVDLCLLNLCEAIYMLPGWQQSAGANREYGYALAKGYEVLGCSTIDTVPVMHGCRETVPNKVAEHGEIEVIGTVERRSCFFMLHQILINICGIAHIVEQRWTRRRWKNESV